MGYSCMPVSVPILMKARSGCTIHAGPIDMVSGESPTMCTYQSSNCPSWIPYLMDSGTG